VGTDSVVLGAWAKIRQAKTILDIGTGTGLLALMCAQRNTTAQIMAVEKDGASYWDAQHNFMQSPWGDRLQAIHCHLADYDTDTKFDYIICNPPYFLNALLSPDERKSDARHANEEWFSLLADRVNSLSIPESTFGCILPDEEYGVLSENLKKAGWQMGRIQKLLPYPGGDKIRVLAEWKRTNENCVPDVMPDIHVRNGDREFSEDYKKLTQDFYLKF